MAAPRTLKTTTVETTTAPAEPQDANDEIIVAPETDSVEEDLIADLLAAGIEEEITYQVRRIAPADKAAYCTKYSRGDLSLDRIREDWGAGTYTITAFDAAKRYKKRNTVKIAESLRPTLGPTSQTTQLAEMAQILRANVPPAQQQGMDMGAVLTSIMQSQTSLLTAILSRPVPVPPPPPDPLPMITAIASLLKPASSEASGVSMLLKGLQLGKEMSGGSDWTDVATRGLDTLAPIVGELVQARKNAAPTAPAATQRPIPHPSRVALPPGHAPAQPAESARETSPETQPENEAAMDTIKKLQWLTRQATVLVVQAEADKNPELYAEVFVDQLPPFFTLAEVREQLDKPDAIDQLGRLHSPVLQYRPWFEKFRKAALRFIVDIETDEKDEAPEGVVIDQVSEATPPETGTDEGES